MSTPPEQNVPVSGHVEEAQKPETVAVPSLGVVTEPKLSPLQSVATSFAAVTGFVLAVILVYVSVVWMNSVIPETPVPNPPSLEEIKAEASPTEIARIQLVNQARLADYKALKDDLIAGDRTRADNLVSYRTQFLDAIPAKFLYPLLALLLGYLFGIHTVTSNSTG
jgi:hypothetical protein